jgi:hypothetical protein
MVVGHTPRVVSRPEPHEMIVSVRRSKHSINDNTYTCQFPLSYVGSKVNSSSSLSTWLKENALNELKFMLISRLCILPTGMSIVWPMTETRTLGTVNNRASLCAAIMDHQNAGKHTIELYVVKNSGKAGTKIESRGSES